MNTPRLRHSVVRFTAVLATGCLAAGLAPAAGFRVGTAAVNITPPNGIPLAGYYHERGSQGVIDDLFVKAAVLEDGQTKVALVVCDLISVPRFTVVEARRLIEQQTGVPGSNVMISATHTHTGPVMTRQTVRDDFDGGSSDLSRKYTAELPARIAQAVSAADQKLTPARVSFAREFEPRLSFNRRYWMKDGSVGWNPGKLNPNIIRPVGPTDPEVGVICFDTPEKKALLTYVNFAIHTDNTGGTRISADMPGALSRVLATYKGGDMMTLFANGACGNLNQINVRWAERQSSTNEANRLGAILGASVFKAYMDLKPVTDTTLRSRSQIVALPLAKVSDDEIREAAETVKKGGQAKFMEQVQAYKALDVRDREGKPLEAEVQVIALGPDLAWIALPGEAFVELGLSIKSASPFAQTHVAELANGSIGYLPNRSAYAEGNYEVVSARCGEGSGEMLVTAATQMLTQLWNESNGAGHAAK
jgi:hypothetical protein